MKKLFVYILIIFSIFNFVSCSKQTEDIKKQDYLTEEIISPTKAKEIISSTSNEVIYALSQKDVKKLSEMTHPIKGVRFTPYTTVSLEEDIIFHKEKMLNFFTDTNLYTWGKYDGIGEDIILTPNEYYNQFIYSADFKNADKIGYNTVLSEGNALENQFEIYEDPIVVEYYFDGFNEEFAGIDWKSLRLVFENYEDNWYLVGIIHNMWTI